jgi:hypothetical protein
MESRYRVICSEAASASLRQLVKRAREHGRVASVLAAAKTISDRLESAPHGLGEPHFHLRALNLVVNVAIVPPLAVSFGIHEEQRFVIVRDISPLPRTGLESES